MLIFVIIFYSGRNLKKKIFFRFVYRGVLSGCVCMCIMCVPCGQGAHPLEVELLPAGSCHVGA